MGAFWNANSDMDWHDEIHRYDEPRTTREPKTIEVKPRMAKASMTVDPKVYALAELFILDMMRTNEIPIKVLENIEPLADRVAKAGQEAMEAACDAIRKELSA